MTTGGPFDVSPEVSFCDFSFSFIGDLLMEDTVRTILAEQEAETLLRAANPILQEAWENYQMIRKLCESYKR